MLKTKDLINFIENSPSCFHAVANAKDELLKANYIELKENERWSIAPGHGYFVSRHDSSIIAFYVPESPLPGYRLIASHTDSPSFKIKKNPTLTAEGHYVKLNTEGYGGMIAYTWFDRPLGVAGRILYKTSSGIQSKLVNLEDTTLIIPSLCIHMNRTVNDGIKIDMQKDMLPLYSCGITECDFEDAIAKAVDMDKDSILGYDLFLFNKDFCSVWGPDNEFISAPRLDNLECMYASLSAFIDSSDSSHISVFVAFDNEEVGSGSSQGAASTFLLDVLSRMNSSLGGDLEDYNINIAESLMISADNAHAVHPNNGDKSDPTNRPLVNKGIVVKYAANQKYCTDAVSAAAFIDLCNRADVSYQEFFNKSGQPGGSTLGNISSSQVSLSAVDVGLPQLAMHSAYETAGVKDFEEALKVFTEFYSE